MTNEDLDLLNSLYKNATMATSSINTILPKVESPKLKSELQAQLNNYSTECQDLRSKIYAANDEPDKINLLTKTYADAGILMSTMMNSSPSHIAEMMIQGTNMGVIEISKALNSDKNILPELKMQAETMLRKEQQYIDKLKAYL